MNSPSRDPAPGAGDARKGTRPETGPVRVQLRRTKGWRMPPNTLKVDRSTRWGNPFSRAHLESFALCGCPNCQVVSFENELTDAGKALIREKLAGKNLACWCPLDRMCHADILLGIANGHEPRMPADGAPLRQDETDASPRGGDSRSEGTDT